MNLKISASIFISLIFLMHDGNALQIDLTKFASKIAEDMNTNLGVRYVQVSVKIFAQILNLPTLC